MFGCELIVVFDNADYTDKTFFKLVLMKSVCTHDFRINKKRRLWEDQHAVGLESFLSY